MIDRRGSASFYNTIQTPVLTCVTRGLAMASFPANSPTCCPTCSQESSSWDGALCSGAETAAVLTGEVNGKKTHRHDGKDWYRQAGEPFIARLWATRSVASFSTDPPVSPNLGVD